MGTYLPIRKTQDNPIYAGLVESMDVAVGVVLASLKELGLDKNTIVVFTSDNGGVVAGDSYSTSNLPLRAGKGYQYEGGIREPYFIKVPWLQHESRVCATPVTGTDFYPTLLELVGAKLRPAEHMDGVSLVPLLNDGQISDRPLIWHYPHYGNQGGEPSSIIRYGDWKLIHYYEDGRDELYDLKTDLGEVSDASVENMEVVINLKRILFDYLKSAGARFPIPDPLYDKAKEQEYLRKVAGEGVQKQEEIRMKYLSKDFDPKNNWWGSAID
jgi:arylsulfatase A-like enzyme